MVRYSRFKDVKWFPKEGESVLIGGCGGIGSWLTFFLSRAGFKVTVFDYDYVEEINLGGQLFHNNSVGKLKVLAMSDIIVRFCDNDINAIAKKITETCPYHHFMFSAFDNMEARKNLFNIWKVNLDTAVVKPVFIDGRLTINQLQIFVVTQDKIADYEKKLFNDDKIKDEPCTMRQTSHMAAMIASLMTGFFTNHISNIYQRNNDRFNPFFYEHYMPLNIITTK